MKYVHTGHTSDTAVLGYTGDAGIYWGNLSYWDYVGIRDFLSTILGFSEIAAVATNLYTGWPLFEFEPLLEFEEVKFSYLAYIDFKKSPQVSSN